MGADSRATAGNIIADKHCEKVHYLTQSIYACGAGTAADLDQVRTGPCPGEQVSKIQIFRTGKG